MTFLYDTVDNVITTPCYYASQMYKHTAFVTE